MKKVLMILGVWWCINTILNIAIYLGDKEFRMKWNRFIDEM